MRVVYETDDLGVKGGDELHATGYAHVSQSLAHSFLADAQLGNERYGRKGIVHVEEARHRDGDLACPRGCVRDEMDAAQLWLDVGCPDIGHARRTLSTLRRELHNSLADLRSGKNLFYAVSLQVDDAHRCVPKDAQLRGEVILEIRVLGGRNMIAPEIQERTGRKVQPVHAVVFEAVARHLHRYRSKLRVTRVRDMAPKVGSFGRRVDALDVFDTVVHVDGAHHAAAAVTICCVHDGTHHIRAGGLALSARDAKQRQIEVGMSPRLTRNESHGLAESLVGRDDARHVRRGCHQVVGMGAVAQVGDGTLLQRGGEVCRAKRRTLANEHIARTHYARVGIGTRDTYVFLNLRGSEQSPCRQQIHQRFKRGHVLHRSSRVVICCPIIASSSIARLSQKADWSPASARHNARCSRAKYGMVISCGSVWSRRGFT